MTALEFVKFVRLTVSSLKYGEGKNVIFQKSKYTDEIIKISNLSVEV